MSHSETALQAVWLAKPRTRKPVNPINDLRDCRRSGHDGKARTLNTGNVDAAKPPRQQFIG